VSHLSIILETLAQFFRGLLFLARPLRRVPQWRRTPHWRHFPNWSTAWRLEVCIDVLMQAAASQSVKWLSADSVYNSYITTWSCLTVRGLGILLLRSGWLIHRATSNLRRVDPPPLQITHSASAHGVFACRLFWPCWNLINTAVHGKVNGWLYSVMATETVEDAHLAQNAQWTLNRQLLTTHDDWLRAAGKDLSRTVPPAAMNDRRHHFGVMCQGHAPVPVCADHDKSTGAHCRPSHFRNRSSRYYSHSVGASN